MPPSDRGAAHGEAFERARDAIAAHLAGLVATASLSLSSRSNPSSPRCGWRHNGSSA